jgi:DMSO/TMAO reductase YedYZ heme-binding membrane subunit
MIDQTAAGRRRLPAPRQSRPDLLLIMATFGFVGVVGLFLIAESAGSLAAPGGRMTALGRLTGLIGTYLLLILTMLIGRVPALERVVGQSTLTYWHALLAPWTLALLSAHAALIAIGYAQGLKLGSLHEFGVIVITYPWMPAATAGLALLLLAGFTSYRAARRRMLYETWWAIHLYTYLAVALSLPHQLATGASFLGHPWARAFWIGLWVLTGRHPGSSQ